MNGDFPERVKSWLRGADAVERDDMGLSDDGIWKVRRGGERFYIKYGGGQGLRRERQVLAWLQGKLPVPRVLDACEEGDMLYLAMSEVAGEMACARERLARPQQTVRLLAQGIQMLWTVPIEDCPLDERVDAKLRRAEEGLDSQTQWHCPGYRSPQDLLAWLQDNRPREDLVFSHGDYCLPNVLLGDGAIRGFVDWNRGGVADRHQDIALCLRSMAFNFGTDAYGPLLLDELEIDADEGKLRYYRLLDEL